MDFSGKKVAVVGYGVEGAATAEYIIHHGGEVTVCDSNEALTVADGMRTQLGQHYAENLDSFDVIFRSPSVRPDVLERYSVVMTSTRLFLEQSPGLVIGVTGTKGKGTTSTLISKLVEAVGLKSWLGGNIGTPKLSFLDDITTDDVAVLELSSFQLIDSNRSPEIAVCLMIEPDHLNWHPDMNEYINAKAHITLHQQPSDVFIHHPTNQNVQTIVSQSPAQKMPFLKSPAACVENDYIIWGGEKLLPIGEVGMIGVHNLENICAALTALEQCLIRKNLDLSDHRHAVANVIRDFKGLEHRLEFVREFDGIRYFNDSFSTMPAAAIAGVRAFGSPVIAIIGGVDKQVDLSELAKELTICKKVILIGEIAPKLKQLLDEENYQDAQIVQGDMKAIVDSAHTLAKTGDVVLLSPGSSSFDMFASYKDRGNQFKEVVRSL